MAYPPLRWDWDQCKQHCTLWANTMAKRDTAEKIHRWTAPEEEYSVALFKWEWSNPSTSNSRSETQLRNRSGELYSNRYGADTASDRAVTTTEQRGGPTQYPGQALITTTPVKPHIKGITAHTSGPTSCTRRQTPEARGTMILQAVKRRSHSKFARMRRQINVLQTKEQDKNLQEQHRQSTWKRIKSNDSRWSKISEKEWKHGLRRNKKC